MTSEASGSLLSRHPSWLCFAVSAVVPTGTYLAALLLLGADTAQGPLLLMVGLLGFVLGWALPADWTAMPRQVAMAALAGVFVGWLVAVVITWGFALFGVWVVPAYALACLLGRCIGLRRLA